MRKGWDSSVSYADTVTKKDNSIYFFKYNPVWDNLFGSFLQQENPWYPRKVINNDYIISKERPN